MTVSIDTVGIVVLLLVFLVGTTTRANLGVLGLVAAFVVGGPILGEEAADLLAGFPATLFVLYLGVTYLFSVATANGTMDWIVACAARLVRGRAAAVPTGLFVSSTVMASLGVPAPAAVAMLAPVGIRLGRQHAVPILLSGLMVVLGSCAGTFSPISLIAIVTAQSVRSAGLTVSPASLYALGVGTHTLLAAAVLTWSAVGSRTRRPAPEPVAVSAGGSADPEPTAGPAPIPDEPEPPGAGAITTPVAATVAGFVVVLAGAIAFDSDLGLLALTVALVLHLAFPREGSMSGISWDAILMICGLVTYIGVLQRAGTITRIGRALAAFGSPLLAAVLICFAAAIVSAFASSPATIGATIPLAVPLMTGAGLPVLGVTAAIALSSVLVDASPFSATGALAVAGAPPEHSRRLLRGLTVWGLSMIVVAPLLTVGLFVAVPALL